MVRTPVQIAYFVPDIREAATEHAATFGSGPFFVADNIKFASCSYRGKATDWDHSSAFGQWGDVMVEFMQQNTPGDSVLHDVFPEGSNRYGIHHMSYFVDDPEHHAAELETKGIKTALCGVLINGIDVLMVDTTPQYGHMLELYKPSAKLLEIFDFVRQQSIGFDGIDPVRLIEL